MAQAKTFSAQELRRVLDYTATRMHAARNTQQSNCADTTPSWTARG